MELDEDMEYDFSPLFMRVSDINASGQTVVISTPFPHDFSVWDKPAVKLPYAKVVFASQEGYMGALLKVRHSGNTFVIEAATSYKILSDTLKNLMYILLFLTPLILLFSMLGAKFLIERSFAPVRQVVQTLRSITAQNLSLRLPLRNSSDEIDALSDEINNLLGRLENAFKKISQFSADASHELKTPLTIIRGEMEIALRKQRSREQYQNILQSCLEEVDTIEHTVSDLLFLAKSQTLSTKESEDVYLDELIVSCVQKLRESARDKNITIRVDIKEAIQIRGHEQLLQIALHNLLANALQYSHENGQVEVRLQRMQNTIAVTVSDNGIGIKDEDVPKVFETFYRVDKSRAKHAGGSGLGLAIADKIAKLHGAEISIQSVYGRGTKVTLRFNGPSSLAET